MTGDQWAVADYWERRKFAEPICELAHNWRKDKEIAAELGLPVSAVRRALKWWPKAHDGEPYWKTVGHPYRSGKRPGEAA